MPAGCSRCMPSLAKRPAACVHLPAHLDDRSPCNLHPSVLSISSITGLVDSTIHASSQTLCRLCACQLESTAGMVTVDWPNGISARHHASPASGYDLCYSRHTGDLVTLFTARQGLNVHIPGADYRAHGTLLRPVAVSGYGVVWSVDFPYRQPSSGSPRAETYLMDTSSATPTSRATRGAQVASGLRVSACELGNGHPAEGHCLVGRMHVCVQLQSYTERLKRTVRGRQAAQRLSK